jgi:hypothetical protein
VTHKDHISLQPAKRFYQLREEEKSVCQIYQPNGIEESGSSFFPLFLQLSGILHWSFIKVHEKSGKGRKIF